MNKKLINLAATATTVLSLMAGSASAKFTSVDPIIKTLNIEGQTTTLTFHPEFSVSGSDGAVKVDLNSVIDATDLQGDLSVLMNKRWKYDECGERFSTHGTTVHPIGDGRLHVGVTAQAQLWKCVKTKIPKIYSKMIRIGPLKTKVPTVHWVMKTMKTKVISQSVRVEAAVRPVVNGDTVTAEVTVTKAMPSGLAKTLVKVFGLHGKVKDLIQRKIDGKLRGQQFRLPEEVRAFNVVINSASFIDLGGGRLGLKLSASGFATQTQLAELINEQIGKMH